MFLVSFGSLFHEYYPFNTCSTTDVFLAVKESHFEKQYKTSKLVFKEIINIQNNKLWCEIFWTNSLQKCPPLYIPHYDISMSLNVHGGWYIHSTSRLRCRHNLHLRKTNSTQIYPNPVFWMIDFWIWVQKFLENKDWFIKLVEDLFTSDNFLTRLASTKQNMYKMFPEVCDHYQYLITCSLIMYSVKK